MVKTQYKNERIKKLTFYIFQSLQNWHFFGIAMWKFISKWLIWEKKKKKLESCLSFCQIICRKIAWSATTVPSFSGHCYPFSLTMELKILETPESSHSLPCKDSHLPSSLPPFYLLCPPNCEVVTAFLPLYLAYPPVLHGLRRFPIFFHT